MQRHRLVLDVAGPEAEGLAWGRCEVNGANAGLLEVEHGADHHVRVLSPWITMLTVSEITFVLGRYPDDPFPRRIVVYEDPEGPLHGDGEAL